MRKVAVLETGTYFNHKTFHNELFTPFIEKLIYFPDLTEKDLENIDVLVVPSQSHKGLLEKHKTLIQNFAKQKDKCVAVFGPQVVEIVPYSNWKFYPTNFWWWKEENPQSGLELVNSEFDLFKNYISLKDATWHQHGAFYPSSQNFTPLIKKSEYDNGLIAYFTNDENGCYFAATLDPDFHFGLNFMPITKVYLKGLLNWLANGEFK